MIRFLLAVPCIGMSLFLPGCSQGTVPPPIADFRFAPCFPPAQTEIHFADQSFSKGVAIGQWKWDFGDGTTSTDRHPVHAYAQPGAFNVTLTVLSPAGSHTATKLCTIGGSGALPRPEVSTEQGERLRIQLTPLGQGSRIRIARPENPEAGFILWAPENVSYPQLNSGGNELAEGPIDWQQDEGTGALHYAIDRKEASFEAFFVPHEDCVECFYVVQPKPEGRLPETVFINSCEEMLEGIFEGDHSGLLNRLWFVSDASWVSIGSCPEAGLKNEIPPKGVPASAQSNPTVHRINSRGYDLPLLACTSRDGQWIAATAAGKGAYVFSNAAPGFRCLHTSPIEPLRSDGPTVVRMTVYLFQGSLEMLRNRYEQTARDWASAPAKPPQFEGKPIAIPK